MQQASNVRCEDGLVNHVYEDGSVLFAIFDGTSWRGVYAEGGYEVAQEVVAALPRFVWAEMCKLKRTGGGGASQDQGGSQKRSRAEPPHLSEASIHKALHRAVLGLDDHLYAFEVGGKRYGCEAGGSLLMLYLLEGVLYSLCVGDCEGAAFRVAEGVEMKLANWPHNVNFAKEMQHIKTAWGLESLDCFFYDPQRKLFFLRDLQTTRFLGAWHCKLQCRQQTATGQLCNEPCPKNKFFCVAHSNNEERAKTMSHWEPELRTIRDFDFVVWASDGLWDQFTTGRACEIVAGLEEAARCKAPKVLMDTCLRQAVFSAPKNKKKAAVADAVEYLSSLNSVARRLVHDDVTIQVLFCWYRDVVVADFPYDPVERSQPAEEEEMEEEHQADGEGSPDLPPPPALE